MQEEAVRALDIELRFWPTGLTRPTSSSDEVIFIHKSLGFMERLDAVLAKVSPRRMIEIGILDGGSTIYWHSRYDLELLVAFELSHEAPFLTNFLRRNKLEQTVQIHLGVSQDDREQIRSVVSGDFDAIIDDASHQYAETKASFETLFPFLRPGGVYIIEDWAWGHDRDWPPTLWSDCPLMSPLLSELMLICGHASGVIDSIEIDRSFVVVWRGQANLPRDNSFRLEDHYLARGFAVAL